MVTTWNSEKNFTKNYSKSDLYNSRLMETYSSFQSFPDAIHDPPLLCRRVNHTVSIL